MTDSFFLNIMSSHLFRCVLSHIFDRLILCRHILQHSPMHFKAGCNVIDDLRKLKEIYRFMFFPLFGAPVNLSDCLPKPVIQYSQPLVQDIPQQPSLMYLFISPTIYVPNVFISSWILFNYYSCKSGYKVLVTIFKFFELFV